MLDVILWILYAFLGILGAILFVIIVLICIKFTITINYTDEVLSIYVKVLGIKIDVNKVIDRFNKPKKEKTVKVKKRKSENPVTQIQELEVSQENIQKTQEEPDNKSSETTENYKKAQKKKKTKFDFKKIIQEKDKYLEILSEVIDMLNELAFSFYFKDITISAEMGTDDPCKTGKYIGYFWSIYGSASAFIFSHFRVKKHKVNLRPLWNTDKFVVNANANIVICVRIINILRHVKYKKILEIRKRVL